MSKYINIFALRLFFSLQLEFLNFNLSSVHAAHHAADDEDYYGPDMRWFCSNPQKRDPVTGSFVYHYDASNSNTMGLLKPTEVICMGYPENCGDEIPQHYLENKGHTRYHDFRDNKNYYDDDTNIRLSNEYHNCETFGSGTAPSTSEHADVLENLCFHPLNLRDPENCKKLEPWCKWNWVSSYNTFNHPSAITQTTEIPALMDQTSNPIDKYATDTIYYGQCDPQLTIPKLHRELLMNMTNETFSDMMPEHLSSKAHFEIREEAIENEKELARKMFPHVLVSIDDTFAIDDEVEHTKNPMKYLDDVKSDPNRRYLSLRKMTRERDGLMFDNEYTSQVRSVHTREVDDMSQECNKYYSLKSEQRFGGWYNSFRDNYTEFDNRDQYYAEHDEAIWTGFSSILTQDLSYITTGGLKFSCEKSYPEVLDLNRGRRLSNQNVITPKLEHISGNLNVNYDHGYSNTHSNTAIIADDTNLKTATTDHYNSLTYWQPWRNYEFMDLDVRRKVGTSSDTTAARPEIKVGEMKYSMFILNKGWGERNLNNNITAKTVTAMAIRQKYRIWDKRDIGPTFDNINNSSINGKNIFVKFNDDKSSNNGLDDYSIHPLDIAADAQSNITTDVNNTGGNAYTLISDRFGYTSIHNDDFDPDDETTYGNLPVNNFQTPTSVIFGDVFAIQLADYYSWITRYKPDDDNIHKPIPVSMPMTEYETGYHGVRESSPPCYHPSSSSNERIDWTFYSDKHYVDTVKYGTSTSHDPEWYRENSPPYQCIDTTNKNKHNFIQDVYHSSTGFSEGPNYQGSPKGGMHSVVGERVRDPHIFDYNSMNKRFEPYQSGPARFQVMVDNNHDDTLFADAVFSIKNAPEYHTDDLKKREHDFFRRSLDGFLFDPTARGPSTLELDFVSHQITGHSDYSSLRNQNTHSIPSTSILFTMTSTTTLPPSYGDDPNGPNAPDTNPLPSNPGMSSSPNNNNMFPTMSTTTPHPDHHSGGADTHVEFMLGLNMDLPDHFCSAAEIKNDMFLQSVLAEAALTWLLDSMYPGYMAGNVYLGPEDHEHIHVSVARILPKDDLSDCNHDHSNNSTTSSSSSTGTATTTASGSSGTGNKSTNTVTTTASSGSMRNRRLSGRNLAGISRHLDVSFEITIEGGKMHNDITKHVIDLEPNDFKNALSQTITKYTNNPALLAGIPQGSSVDFSDYKINSVTVIEVPTALSSTRYRDKHDDDGGVSTTLFIVLISIAGFIVIIGYIIGFRVYNQTHNKINKHHYGVKRDLARISEMVSTQSTGVTNSAAVGGGQYTGSPSSSTNLKGMGKGGIGSSTNLNLNRATTQGTSLRFDADPEVSKYNNLNDKNLGIKVEVDDDDDNDSESTVEIEEVTVTEEAVNVEDSEKLVNDKKSLRESISKKSTTQKRSSSRKSAAASAAAAPPKPLRPKALPGPTSSMRASKKSLNTASASLAINKSSTVSASPITNAGVSSSNINMSGKSSERGDNRTSGQGGVTVESDAGQTQAISLRDPTLVASANPYSSSGYDNSYNTSYSGIDYGAYGERSYDSYNNDYNDYSQGYDNLNYEGSYEYDPNWDYQNNRYYDYGGYNDRSSSMNQVGVSTRKPGKKKKSSRN